MRTDKLLHEAPNAAASTDPLPVDLDAVVPCVGYWAGEDVLHTRHTPCPNHAVWAGRSDHDHAKTNARCAEHRIAVDIAISEGTMFCLTCERPMLAMTWWEL